MEIKASLKTQKWKFQTPTSGKQSGISGRLLLALSLPDESYYYSLPIHSAGAIAFCPKILCGTTSI
jgi:hypothetical protein